MREWSTAPKLWHIIERITEQHDRPGGLASYERTRVRRLCRSASDDWHSAEVWDLVRHDGDPSRHPLGLDPAGLERPCAKCLAKQDDIYAVQPEQPLAENRAQHLHDEAVKRLHHFETYGKYKGRPNFSTVTARGIRVELKDIRAVDPDKAAALERLATDFVSALGTILGDSGLCPSCHQRWEDGEGCDQIGHHIKLAQHDDD